MILDESPSTMMDMAKILLEVEDNPDRFPSVNSLRDLGPEIHSFFPHLSALRPLVFRWEDHSPDVIYQELSVLVEAMEETGPLLAIYLTITRGGNVWGSVSLNHEGILGIHPLGEAVEFLPAERGIQRLFSKIGEQGV